MLQFVKYQKLTLLWALFILVLCNIKMGELGHSPRFFPGFDKLVHCGLFFVFTVLYCNGIIRHKMQLKYLTALAVFTLTVVFGAVIELLQLWIFTWRGAELSDLFADVVGVGMALFSVLITQNAVKYEKN